MSEKKEPVSTDLKEKQHPAHELLERVKNPNSLHISRLHPEIKKKFIALADSEFFGDYGICLKFLMDDLISPENKILLDNIRDLNERVTLLEQNKIVPADNAKEPENVRKMCDGSVRPRRN